MRPDTHTPDPPTIPWRCPVSDDADNAPDPPRSELLPPRAPYDEAAARLYVILDQLGAAVAERTPGEPERPEPNAGPFADRSAAEAAAGDGERLAALWRTDRARPSDSEVAAWAVIDARQCN